MEAMNRTVDLADAFYSTNGKPYADRSKESIAPIKSDGNLDLDWPYGERYNDRDPRLKATLFTPYQRWKDNWAPYGGAAASYSTLYVMKYFNPYHNHIHLSQPMLLPKRVRLRQKHWLRKVDMIMMKLTD